MTGVRVDPARALVVASPLAIPALPPVAPAQARNPAVVRWIGLGAVALLVLTFLVLVVRYGSDRDRGGDDSTTLFSPGPAYGLTGSTDVEEVLRVDDGETDEGDGGDDASKPDPSDGRGSGGSADPVAAGDGAAGDAGDDAEFTHDVRERRDDGWLVEVTDGDRSTRFEIGRVGSVLTVDPVASPAQRHGTGWVLRAERYLRDQDLAVGTERE